MQTTFSRSLSEKLIEKGIKWESRQRWYRHHDNGKQEEMVADNCTDWSCSCYCDSKNDYPEKLEPALTLETALSREFLKQLMPKEYECFVEQTARNIGGEYFLGGYELAEKYIMSLLLEK